MKAAVFEGVGRKLVVQDVPDPSAGVGQLTIKVKRCGVCGSDLHLTDETASRHPPKGAIIGHEFCGEIVEVGEGAGPGWREGQRITALPFIGCGACAHCLAGQPVWCAKVRSHAGGRFPGGFAEYVTVGAAESVRLPDTLSWDDGALVEPVAVALHGVALANLRPGADILVFGAGPIGLAVVACARAMGAGTIIVTARSDQRADLARSMGATEFLLNDDALSAGFAPIAGGPPDAVFECVGAPGTLERCFVLAPLRSTVVVMGACLQVDSFQPIVPMMKELRVLFSLAYGVRDFEVATNLLARGRITATPMITDTVGFAAFPEAFEALRSRTSQCKVLLAPEAG